jgi:hypothetical protein
MSDIVKLWDDEDDRQRYRNALRLLRIPYWDWASNRTANGTLFPQSIGGSEYMEINGPNGPQVIRNPLYSYEFKPLDQLDFLDMNPVSLIHTCRDMISSDMGVHGSGTYGMKRFEHPRITSHQHNPTTVSWSQCWVRACRAFNND